MNANLARIEPQAVAVTQAWTEADVLAVKSQIAKDANPEEFKLFLYTATQRGLNPLLKQIYCIHRGGKMTIQTSIDGYRLIANRTGKLSGIKRGVKYDDKGTLTHGWAEVHRKDWEQPVYEEVALKEYTSGQGNWIKMPETMIKKVAEAAALRMAFPEDLSGLYTQDEMDQVDRHGPLNREEKDEIIAWGMERQEKELVAIYKQIAHLMEKEQITKEEVQWAMGLDTLEGVTDLKQLELALSNLIEHIEVKKMPMAEEVTK